MPQDKPLIIITDKEGREEFLADFVSNSVQKIYAIVLRSVGNVQEASRKLKPMCSKYGVLLLAHAETANIKYCDGVHLNAKSKSVQEVRAAFGGNIAIGYSSHSVNEAREALKAGADYVFLSPVFKSKDGLSKPLGLEEFNRAVEEIGSGVFALGGVNSSNVGLLSTKITGIACMSSIFGDNK